jgi:hypothetical protein
MFLVLRLTSLSSLFLSSFDGEKGGEEGISFDAIQFPGQFFVCVAARD